MAKLGRSAARIADDTIHREPAIVRAPRKARAAIEDHGRESVWIG